MRGNFLYLGKVPPFPLQKPAWESLWGFAPTPHKPLKRLDRNFYLSATQKSDFRLEIAFFIKVWVRPFQRVAGFGTESQELSLNHE